MKKWLLWLTLIVARPSLFLVAQNNVSFFEEHIDFTLDANNFIINGIYSFKNETDNNLNQKILFPFANKTSTIDSIRIVNLSTGGIIQFDLLESSVLFNFMLPPNEIIDLNIFYRQKISEVNQYIITSTRAWEKPLETAVYTLTADKKLTIKSFSYPPDSVREINNKQLYFWKKHQFMPKVDFEITMDK